MLKFLRAMPKLQLHAHLGGSCPRNKLITLLQKYGHHKQVENIQHPTYQFGNWFQTLFYPTALMMKTHKGLRQYINAVLETFHNDNVVYLELRTTPRSGVDFTVVDFLNTIIEESEKYHNKMKVKIIVSLNRDIKDYSIYSTLLKDIQKVSNWRRNIVGLDFSGNPTSRTFSQFIPLFKQGRDMGLGMSIHTGQVIGQIPQTKQILSLSPERIGHFSYYTPEQLNTVIQKGTVIEICISSNLIIKGYKSIMDHHIKEFHEKGVKHCICSDDILLFEKEVSDEYENYAKILGVGEKECFELSRKTVEYAFDKGEKEWIEERFMEFVEKNKKEYEFLKE